MAVKSTENRDLWIGHKLGNVITDTKIGGNKEQTEALLVQNGKLVFSLSYLYRLTLSLILAFHEGSVPMKHADLHNFRMGDRSAREIQRKMHDQRFINSGNKKV